MEVSWKAIEAYFKLYTQSIYREIPSYMYFALLLVAVVGFILIFSNQRVKQKWRAFGRLVFFEYVAFLLCMTVFFRESVEHRTFNLIPFWSYTAENADLQHSLYVEALMNVLMFVPFGLFVGCVFKNIGWKKVLVASFFLSILIEVLQFLLERGLAEFDDVFHNTLGAIVGFGLYALLAITVRYMLDRRKTI